LHIPDEEYSIKRASKSLEINLIRKVLKKTKGNHTHAARQLKEYEIVENE
jgi:transcriptional regulator with PAS, ATPase and Fis domain